MLVQVLECVNCDYYNACDEHSGVCEKHDRAVNQYDFCSFAIPRKKEHFIYCPSCGQRIGLRGEDDG